MTNLKKLKLALTITFGMLIALVIGLVNMPKPSVENANNMPLNSLETPITNGGGYSIIKDGNTLKYSYDSTQQSTEDLTKVYQYYFKNIMPADMAVKMQELECDGLTFKYAVSNTEQTDTTSLTFSSTLSVEPLAPKGRAGDEIYVYVKVTATNSSVSFTTPIKWTFGYIQYITCNINGVTSDPILGICNAGITNETDLLTPEIPDGYEVAGWYLDEAHTIPATFPLSIQQTNSQLFAKLKEAYPEGNIPTDEASGWFILNEDGQSYSVQKGVGTLPANLVIPETYNGKPVTAIATASGNSTSAFYAQRSTLKSVTMPITLISIGSFAFRDCSRITSITIPASVTSIGYQAFYGCSGLTSVEFGDNSQLISIEGSAFYRCSGLTSVTIPSSVTSVGDNAFCICSGLTSITIPASVTSIGNGVFNSCSGLTSIVVESENTVYDSRDNRNAIIETLSNTLIRGCKTTVIPNTVTSIGSYAFSGSGLTGISIPSSVTSIGDYAFQSCSGLTSITIPSSVTSIGNYAFYGCSGLTSITIPSSVTSIGNYAFYNCSGLTSITFSDTSTWYRVSSSTNWENKTGGTKTTVTTPSTNVSNFTSKYDYYYWYKL